jgi:hypothetical protein
VPSDPGLKTRTSHGRFTTLDSSLLPSLSSDFRALLLDDDAAPSTADVLFVVGPPGTEHTPPPVAMPAHELILCARSKVLKAMLTGNFKEGQRSSSQAYSSFSGDHAAKKKKQKQIDLPTSEPRLFRQILNFIYSDAVDWDHLATERDALPTATATATDDALALYQEADRYELAGLKPLVVAHLEESLTEDTVLVVWDFAVTTPIQDCRSALAPHCLPFIEKHASALFHHAQWTSLHPRAIRAILKDKALRATETTIFVALHRWHVAFCEREAAEAEAEPEAEGRKGKEKENEEEQEEEEEEEAELMKVMNLEKEDEVDEGNSDAERRSSRKRRRTEENHHGHAKESASEALMQGLLPLIDFRLMSALEITRAVVPTGLVAEPQLLEIYAFATTHHRVTFSALPDGNLASHWTRHADAFSWQVLLAKQSVGAYTVQLRFIDLAESRDIGGTNVLFFQDRAAHGGAITIPPGTIIRPPRDRTSSSHLLASRRFASLGSSLTILISFSC